jgi:hypothetical protein
MAIGIRPDKGFSLPDGEWLRQLSNGNNYSFQSGVVAKAGGTQATGTQLSNNQSLIQVDTVATNNDSVVMPFAAAGKSVSIFNNGAATLGIFASPNTNPLTGTTDVINKTTNPTLYALTSGQTADFSCAKNGTWFACKSA